jgi:hypothetical protein
MVNTHGKRHFIVHLVLANYTRAFSSVYFAFIGFPCNAILGPQSIMDLLLVKYIYHQTSVTLTRIWQWSVRRLPTWDFRHPTRSLLAEELALGWQRLRIVQRSHANVPRVILRWVLRIHREDGVHPTPPHETRDYARKMTLTPYSSMKLPQRSQNSRCSRVPLPLSAACSFTWPLV